MRALLPAKLLRMKFDLYLNEQERFFIEALARKAHLSMSCFVRKAAIGQTISAPPALLTIQQWEKLGRAVDDLNQLAKTNRDPMQSQGVIKRLVEEISSVRLAIVSKRVGNDR